MTKVSQQPKKGAAIEEAQVVTSTELAVIRENGEAAAAEAEAKLAELAAKAEQKPTVSLGERLEKLETLNKLAVKHGKLTGKKAELVDVVDANERGAAVLVLKADGEEVEVKNPEVIAEALRLMVGKIDEMAEQTAAQIIDLNI